MLYNTIVRSEKLCVTMRQYKIIFNTMSLENISNTGNEKIEVMRVEEVTSEMLTEAEAAIEADENLKYDSLAAEMIEKGFKLSDGTFADPDSWINARKAVIAAGPTIIDPKEAKAAMATASETHERLLNDEGLPENTRKEAA